MPRSDQPKAIKSLLEGLERNDLDLTRGKFRVRGNKIEVIPAYEEDGVRIELFADKVKKIATFDPLTGKKNKEMEEITIIK